MQLRRGLLAGKWPEKAGIRGEFYPVFHFLTIQVYQMDAGWSQSDWYGPSRVSFSGKIGQNGMLHEGEHPVRELQTIWNNEIIPTTCGPRHLFPFLVPVLIFFQIFEILPFPFPSPQFPNRLLKAVEQIQCFIRALVIMSWLPCDLWNRSSKQRLSERETDQSYGEGAKDHQGDRWRVRIACRFKK